MSDLTWTSKLHHIRFSRLLLFVEKLFVVLVACLAILMELNPHITGGLVVLLAVMYLRLHSNHYYLEATGGLPVQPGMIAY